MPELPVPYLHVQGVLNHDDIAFLKENCKRHLSQEGMPCFALIDKLSEPTYLKIKRVLEDALKEQLYYLNDFYIYTDSSSKTYWHMDTELFTFASAINAWILMSPDEVTDPLGFIDQMNDAPGNYYHSVRIDGDECLFGDYSSGESTVRSLRQIEARQIHTPKVRVGDILVINPKRFHKTNVDIPKHAFAIKFIFKDKQGFLSEAQVAADFWPEVETFNQLVQGSARWDEVIAGIRRELTTSDGRQRLSAGFYPAKFELYKKMANHL